MTHLLETKELTKVFKGKTALDHVNLQLMPGRIIGLLGPNGSGKSTLMKLACGLLVPTSGEVLIHGQPPSPATKAKVSYLSDRLALPTNMRALEAMDFYRDFYTDFDRARATTMLQSLSIAPDQRLSQMSKGTKEKMQLILTMSRGADLFLLDEPIGGVDPAARDYILNTIIQNYNEKASILFSTHLISDVEKILDDAVFLKDGRLVLQGSVEEIREKENKSLDELFREVFKC